MKVDEMKAKVKAKLARMKAKVKPNGGQKGRPEADRKEALA